MSGPVRWGGVDAYLLNPGTLRKADGTPFATGSATNSFGIVQPITGTTPAASTGNDTLTFASADGSVAIAGNSSTKTIDFSSGETITGSWSSPSAITAAGGITPVASKLRQAMYVHGSGGAVTITASPAIAAGSAEGQILTLIGTDATNTVTIQSAAAGVLLSGDIVITQGTLLTLRWIPGLAKWLEVNRNEI